jgi:hypothetical protein
MLSLIDAKLGVPPPGASGTTVTPAAPAEPAATPAPATP